MPVVVEPDTKKLGQLYSLLPSGSHALDSPRKAMEWLSHRSEEYVVILGPTLALEDAFAIADAIRTSRPATSPVLIRSSVDADLLSLAMKSGIREVVSDDDEAALNHSIGRAYELWQALRGPSGVEHQGRVVTVFSPKGGVGKTTVSVNLALALAQGGVRRVCLLDLDLAFGDVAITLQLFPTHSIEHAVGAEDTLDEKFLDSLLTRHPEGVMVLAAPNLPDARDRISAALLTRILHTLQANFDYVVVDTAPAFDEATLSAMDITDECVVVTTLDVPTLKNVKVALETMDMLGAAEGHRHLVLNRASDEVGIGPDKVESILGLPIAIKLDSDLSVTAATNAGRPIVLASPEHQVARGITQLAALISAQPEQPGSAAAFSPVEPEQQSEHRSGRRFLKRK